MIGLHADQERIEEMCCLFAIGELSPEESTLLSEHLVECELCRNLVLQYERLSVLDLAVLNLNRTENESEEPIESSIEQKLLGQVVARVSAASLTNSLKNEDVPVRVGRIISFGKRMRFLMPALTAGGWAVAAAVLISVSLIRASDRGRPGIEAKSATSAPMRQTSADPSSIADLQSRLNILEAGYTRVLAQLTSEGDRAKSSESALAHARSENAELLAEKSALEAEITQQQLALQDRSDKIRTVSAALDEETLSASQLEAQLREVTATLKTQHDEIAKLHQISATSEIRQPSVGSDRINPAATELFGARDLHIVDVYDVDHSGKPSRTYGRVYYVDQKLLVFYAFDLGAKEPARKLVAFQAWGFRQPNKAEPENLGLFYMDDPKIDRWVLRVSDPKILSNIDTLFVTAEPPGGSNVPKGRHLLLASLSGPPNHP